MIAENYLRLKGQIPEDVLLLVVSKGQKAEDIMECYNAGARDFGENRLQEFLEKKEKLPKDIRWHMIGTIQTKKVPKMAGQFELIHSVDSAELIKKFETHPEKTRILLEANVSGEETKHGLTADQWIEEYGRLKDLKNVSIEGLMTMAPYVEDEIIIKNCFINLRKLRDELSKRGAPLKELSMGMSHDWKIALEEGATIVRIGSLIFKT